MCWESTCRCVHNLLTQHNIVFFEAKINPKNTKGKHDSRPKAHTNASALPSRCRNFLESSDPKATPRNPATQVTPPNVKLMLLNNRKARTFNR